MAEYEYKGREIGHLVAEKQRQYGDSISRSEAILLVLYPEGIRPDQYTDALLVVRIADKLCRISERGADGADLGGESPFRDLAGYGILGTIKDEAVIDEASDQDEPPQTDKDDGPIPVPPRPRLGGDSEPPKTSIADDAECGFPAEARQALARKQVEGEPDGPDAGTPVEYRLRDLDRVIERRLQRNPNADRALIRRVWTDECPQKLTRQKGLELLDEAFDDYYEEIP